MLRVVPCFCGGIIGSNCGPLYPEAWKYYGPLFGSFMIPLNVSAMYQCRVFTSTECKLMNIIVDQLVNVASSHHGFSLHQYSWELDLLDCLSAPGSNQAIQTCVSIELNFVIDLLLLLF
jgi:hypothetical protein